MKENRGRSSEGDEVEGLAEKKRPQDTNEVLEEEMPGVHIRLKPTKTKFDPLQFSPMLEKV